jgi:hypothetical protein
MKNKKIAPFNNEIFKFLKYGDMKKIKISTGFSVSTIRRFFHDQPKNAELTNLQIKNVASEMAEINRQKIQNFHVEKSV